MVILKNKIRSTLNLTEFLKYAIINFQITIIDHMRNKNKVRSIREKRNPNREIRKHHQDGKSYSSYYSISGSDPAPYPSNNYSYSSSNYVKIPSTKKTAFQQDKILAKKYFKNSSKRNYNITNDFNLTNNLIHNLQIQRYFTIKRIYKILDLPASYIKSYNLRPLRKKIEKFKEKHSTNNYIIDEQGDKFRVVTSEKKQIDELAKTLAKNKKRINSIKETGKDLKLRKSPQKYISLKTLKNESTRSILSSKTSNEPKKRKSVSFKEDSFRHSQNTQKTSPPSNAHSFRTRSHHPHNPVALRYDSLNSQTRNTHRHNQSPISRSVRTRKLPTSLPTNQYFDNYQTPIATTHPRAPREHTTTYQTQAPIQSRSGTWRLRARQQEDQSYTQGVQYPDF
jgi:hypothetical protein